MSLVDDLKPSEGQQNGFVSVVSVELRRGTERERERERESWEIYLACQQASLHRPQKQGHTHNHRDETCALASHRYPPQYGVKGPSSGRQLGRHHNSLSLSSDRKACLK